MWVARHVSHAHAGNFMNPGERVARMCCHSSVKCRQRDIINLHVMFSVKVCRATFRSLRRTRVCCVRIPSCKERVKGSWILSSRGTASHTAVCCRQVTTAAVQGHSRDVTNVICRSCKASAHLCDAPNSVCKPFACLFVEFMLARFSSIEVLIRI